MCLPRASAQKSQRISEHWRQQGRRQKGWWDQLLLVPGRSLAPVADASRCRPIRGKVEHACALSTALYMPQEGSKVAPSPAAFGHQHAAQRNSQLRAHSSDYAGFRLQKPGLKRCRAYVHTSIDMLPTRHTGMLKEGGRTSKKGIGTSALRSVCSVVC
jgi:hypothetical protein